MLVNPYQTGFVPGKFIGDNGIALSMVLDQAKGLDLQGIGLLLDQEKAYDRVHPEYLSQVLLKFGFSSSFVNCIRALFFGNSVYININGFFTPCILQQRGLRQGDPLSPLLFNLALEPLLLSILQDDQLRGFTFQGSSTTEGTPSASLTLKLLAYADDVCLLLRDRSDFTRAQRHMMQYTSVSNAKFNIDKTEAFSLNGKLNTSWKCLLTHHDISTYYHAGSSQAFRYLGFYLPYCTRQRRLIEDRMLVKVTTQCQIYSQRQLSILGRVTIVNILILSKVWYSLRLLNPTKRFLQRLQSLIYQFVWQKKHPALKKELIFLSWSHGGLQVLNPDIQHHILQKRWLNYIFDSTEYPSFVYPLVLNHLSLFLNSSNCPLVPFYFPEYRKSRVCDNNLSIWNAIFAAYDVILAASPIPFPALPLPTLMELPLHKLLLPTSTDEHWTVKHTSFTANQFFIFDTVQDRLRLRVPGEYTRYPRLCLQLYQDILQTRVVRLVPQVWPYITDGVSSPTAWSGHSITLNIIRSTLWKQYSSRNFRDTMQSTSSLPIRFSSTLIKTFWSCPMYPNARTLFFRCLSACLPTKKILFKYGLLSSSICSLCGGSTDSKRHFLVECAIKWGFWKKVLKHYYPRLGFTSEDIYQSLRHLKLPSHLRIPSIKQFFSVLSTTLYQLWIVYWQHGNDTPYTYPLSQIEPSSLRIITQIERLLHSNLD